MPFFMHEVLIADNNNDLLHMKQLVDINLCACNLIAIVSYTAPATLLIGLDAGHHKTIIIISCIY